MFDEASIINLAQKAFPAFIGDDAAVLPLDATYLQIISKDLLIEDVHFRLQYFSPFDLANKALQVNLSDIVAMGGQPQHILCGLGVPKNKTDIATKFMSNLIKLCQDMNINLIGGDTVKSPDKFFISISVIGSVKRSHIKYRHTAQINDYICVAGNLGYAHLGLQQCENSSLEKSIYKQAFLQPQAKIKEGLWLATQPAVTSMMDLSDGLWIDLTKICAASNVAGVIELERFSIKEKFNHTCLAMRCDPITVMLTGGEDYALLFTVQPEVHSMICDSFFKNFGYNIQRIGYLSSGNGVSTQLDGKSINLHLKPFSHFT